jgi:hypothetical protein
VSIVGKGAKKLSSSSKMWLPSNSVSRLNEIGDVERRRR